MDTPTDRPNEDTSVDDWPRFPEHLMTTVRTTMVWNFENADISTPEDLHHLLSLMFDQPEHEFYVFLQKHASLTEDLARATDSIGGDIKVVQTDLRFYRRPGTKNFMQVRSDDSQFEWVREVAKTQEYIRFTLRLSERARREMEVKQHLAAHSEANANPLMIQPNFVGFGINLFKGWRWLKERLRS